MVNLLQQLFSVRRLYLCNGEKGFLLTCFRKVIEIEVNKGGYCNVGK